MAGDEQKVWLSSRKLASGKTSYHLRWICPTEKKWKSKGAGTDYKRALGKASELEKQLSDGTYTDLRAVSWDEFVKEHTERIPGEKNRIEAKRTLDEFGRETKKTPPRRVTFAMIESYVEAMNAKGNTHATINKKLRYLRAAFNKAVKRGYLAKSPMSSWDWTAEQDKPIRELSQSEQARLLAAAKDLYGFRWWSFIYLAVNTGGRRGELLALPWDRVDFEDGSVLFTHTKGKRNRRLPVLPGPMRVLRRLQIQTLQAGGPFVGMGEHLRDEWLAILEKSGIAYATPHDLRRTYITRLIRAGVSLPTVQKLAGHVSITTTLKFYTHVGAEDLRAGVEKLRPQAPAKPATKAQNKKTAG